MRAVNHRLGTTRYARKLSRISCCRFMAVINFAVRCENGFVLLILFNVVSGKIARIIYRHMWVRYTRLIKKGSSGYLEDL